MCEVNCTNCRVSAFKHGLCPDDFCEKHKALGTEDDFIRTLQPEPHWIPVTERLPEENGQYLITVKYKHVDGYEDVYAEHGEWEDGKWDMFGLGHCGEVENILAWMPLPEPYTEDNQ